jgi:hypothetical protein
MTECVSVHNSNLSFRQLPFVVVAFFTTVVGAFAQDQLSDLTRLGHAPSSIHESITHTIEPARPRAIGHAAPMARKQQTTTTNAISNGSATPAAVNPGQAVTIKADFRLAQDATVVTYYEIRDEGGAIVAHQSYNSQTFAAGQTRSYSWNVTIPSYWMAGTYQVHAGVFTADWSSNLVWVSGITRVAVRSGTSEPPPSEPPPTEPPPTEPPPTEPPAASCQFYIDSASGNDAQSGTSPSTPWRSLGKVNGTTFQPGHVICFKRGGVWTGNLQVKQSGTAANPITYGAYDTGAAPQIKNPGVTWGHAVTVTGRYNVIQDLLLTDAHEAGVMLRPGASNNVVQRNEITRTGTGVTAAGEANVLTGNYVHDLTMIVNDSAPYSDYGAVCFWLQANDNEVSYNMGINCKAPSHDFGYDGGFVEIWQTGDNTSVHHNYAENTNGFFELGASGNGSAQNVRVAYNAIVNVTGQGSGTSICFNTGSYNITLGAFKFENNTFVSRAGHPDAYRVFGCRSDLSQLQLRNNIFYSDLQIANNGNFTHANNLYYMVNMVNGSGVGFGLGSGERIVDPQFRNVGANDFRLQASSLAIDAGEYLGYTKDFKDVPVPQGGAPDLGAHEFQP